MGPSVDLSVGQFVGRFWTAKSPNIKGMLLMYSKENIDFDEFAGFAPEQGNRCMYECRTFSLQRNRYKDILSCSRQSNFFVVAIRISLNMLTHFLDA